MGLGVAGFRHRIHHWFDKARVTGTKHTGREGGGQEGLVGLRHNTACGGAEGSGSTEVRGSWGGGGGFRGVPPNYMSYLYVLCCCCSRTASCVRLGLPCSNEAMAVAVSPLSPPYPAPLSCHQQYCLKLCAVCVCAVSAAGRQAVSNPLVA